MKTKLHYLLYMTAFLAYSQASFSNEYFGIYIKNKTPNNLVDLKITDPNKFIKPINIPNATLSPQQTQCIILTFYKNKLKRKKYEKNGSNDFSINFTDEKGSSIKCVLRVSCSHITPIISKKKTCDLPLIYNDIHVKSCSGNINIYRTTTIPPGQKC